MLETLVRDENAEWNFTSLQVCDLFHCSPPPSKCDIRLTDAGGRRICQLTLQLHVAFVSLLCCLAHVAVLPLFSATQTTGSDLPSHSCLLLSSGLFLDSSASHKVLFFVSQLRQLCLGIDKFDRFYNVFPRVLHTLADTCPLLEHFTCPQLLLGASEQLYATASGIWGGVLDLK